MTTENQKSNYQSPHHSFNVEYASMYGVEESILIHHFQHWINLNKRLDRNYHDGRTWTYQTLDEIAATFSYFSRRQIERIINSLVSKKIIRKSNYNRHKMDRTVWYSFENEIKFTISPNGDQVITKRGSGDHQTVTPIPDTKTNTKTSLSVATAPVGAPPSKIKVKTMKGDIVLDETDIYRKIIKEKVSWSSEEITYATEALEKYNEIVHDWFRFLQGTVQNYRNLMKSKKASGAKQNHTRSSQTPNRRKKCSIDQKSKNCKKPGTATDLSVPRSQRSPSLMEAIQEMSLNG